MRDTRTSGGGERTVEGNLTTTPLTSFTCPDQIVVELKRKKRKKGEERKTKQQKQNDNLLLTKPAATRPAWWLLSEAKNRPWSGPLRRRWRLERAGLARCSRLWEEPGSDTNQHHKETVVVLCRQTRLGISQRSTASSHTHRHTDVWKALPGNDLLENSGDKKGTERWLRQLPTPTWRD